MKIKKYYILFFIIATILSGCVPSSLKKRTDPLLYSQSVKGNKTIESEKLAALLPQKPNKRIFMTPLSFSLFWYQADYGRYLKKKPVWQQQLAKLNEDFNQKTLGMDNNSEVFKKIERKKEKKSQKLTKRINEGTWVMRTLGEAPVYFNEEAQDNTEKMRKYLFNKGFFKAKVSFKTDTVFLNRVSVTYNITEGSPSVIEKNDSLSVQDSTMKNLLKTNISDSKLAKGERFDLENYNAEKNRIEALLKNNGYYQLTKDNISLRIDDTRDTTGKLGVITYIPHPDRSPRNPNYKKQYSLSKIQFVVDGTSPTISAPVVDTVRYNNIEYLFINKRYSTKRLDYRIDLRPDQLYSLQNVVNTQKKLYGLDQFKFANINFDTTRGSLRTTIYTVPLDKYQFTAEAGGSIFKFVPGPFGNVSLRIRNILGGLESLETNFRLGYEAQAGFLQTERVSQNLETGVNMSLIFPEMLIPRKWARQFENFNPRTQLGIGFDYTGRPEYNRANFKINTNYSWRPGPNKFFQVSVFDINLINTIYPDNQLSRDFRQYLEQLKLIGNNLYRSFQQSFVSSISGSYTYTDNPYGQTPKGKYFKIFVESGGTTLNLFGNNGFHFLKTLLRTDTLQFYKFFKVSADFRKYIPLGVSNKAVLAYRINTGVAYAYGQAGERELPYEKNFFIGGPNSVRAWKPRRLGTGSYAGNVDYKFEQPGSILLETSAELRFKILRLYGDLNGAFFVDAGNVWTFSNQSTTDRQGSDFNFNRFYKEIAVGTGFGVRYDF
ncbi:BamA/TamA family outer membrane protein [Pseudarcicella hirudinis]|uniref:translocation and assembly module lipoprotein TamL n=1 Tax=Pseudarcicella hirudinis TaxID=1079859 RepID=UPI0035EDF29C